MIINAPGRGQLLLLSRPVCRSSDQCELPLYQCCSAVLRLSEHRVGAVSGGPGMDSDGSGELFHRDLRQSLVTQIDTEVGVETTTVPDWMVPKDLDAAHCNGDAAERAVAAKLATKAVSTDTVVAEVLGFPVVHSGNDKVGVAVTVEVCKVHLAMVAAGGIGAARVVDADSRRRVGVNHPHRASRAANGHVRRDGLAVGRALDGARAGAVIAPAVVPPSDQPDGDHPPVWEEDRHLTSHLPGDRPHGWARLENAGRIDALAACQSPVGELRHVCRVVEPKARPWISAVHREAQVIGRGCDEQLRHAVTVKVSEETAHRAFPGQLTKS